MSFPARWLICLIVLLAWCLNTHAQVSAAAGIAPVHAPDKVQAVPRVPGLSTIFDGLNAGVTYSAVHSSAGGWYSVSTPAVSYTFSRHFSADAGTSIYLSRLVENTNRATAAKHRLVAGGVDPGDTLIGLHGFFDPGSLQDTVTFSLTAPTGDRAKGFGTGQATFDASNHAERYFKRLGVLLDVGAGNSSGLFNNVVSKNYNSVGGLAHFETGLVYWFPHRMYLEAVSYEQLPLGSQTVYRTVPEGDGVKSKDGPRGEALRADDDGGPPAPVPVTVTTVSEDNGFTTFAGIPLTDYITLSGYYNRSLRQRLDTVSFGVTYVLRGTSRKRLSLIDRALREAENASQ